MHVHQLRNLFLYLLPSESDGQNCSPMQIILSHCHQLLSSSNAFSDLHPSSIPEQTGLLSSDFLEFLVKGNKKIKVKLSLLYTAT